ALWTGVYHLARIPDWALARACEVGLPFRLLVLAEDWCGDASNTIPYVAKLGEQARCLEMRILRRDEHPAVMDRYLSGAARAIPIVIVLAPPLRWSPRVVSRTASPGPKTRPASKNATTLSSTILSSAAAGIPRIT